MSTVVNALQEALGESSLVTGSALAERATSYWNSEPTRALVMLRPKTTEELSRIMAICHAHNQPVVVQGGLTGCVEGAVSGEREIIVSLERMNQIEQVDAVGGTATVQSGVILEVLQNELAEQGLLFPLDLGARGSCTIGGNIATNAGGINVLRYGMMRDLVLGLEAVQADGTVLSSMNRMIKNNAGYDLKQLFIGTEGTLGIVTRAVVKLFPQPKSKNSALVALQDFDAVARLLQVLRGSLAGTLSAFELMWGDYFHAVTRGTCLMWRPGRPAGIGILVVTRATDPSKPFSIRSLTSITRHSLRLWQSRERNCRAMCNGNLKNFSNAGGWSMAFYGFAASLATPSTWSLSAVSVAVSARAVGRGGWPKVPPCWLMKYCLNNPCVSGC